MASFLSVFIGKSVMKFMKVLRFNSSVYPGFIVRKLFPNFLNKVTYPKLTIMVTGSSGKGSTTKLICNILKNNGYTVTNNNLGSNLINAFTTTIIKDCNFKGEVNTDALVFEVDERFVKELTKYIKPNYLIINNITRDQPPRQGSFDIVFEEIRKGLYDNMHLILNGDDPITRKFSLYHKGKITYFGISKNDMSFNKPINYVKDYLFCPNCNSKLKFDYYHYGSVGKFHCTNCDFRRSNIKYEVTKIDKNSNNIVINKEYKININNLLLFNIYNICAAFALSSEIGIKNENIINSLNNYGIDKKIFNEFVVENRKYTVLNCKAENNTTYNLSLLYTSLDDDVKTIVLGLREISRRYKHFDVSWIYDISFELLLNNNVDKIICAGPYRYDFACALKYIGIDENNIIIIENLNNIKTIINNKTKGNVYGILNFDYIEPFINEIKEVK